MSVHDKSGKEEVTFTLAIVKAGTISDRAEFARIQIALQAIFPALSLILVAEDDELASYQRRRELSDFMNSAPCKVIPSSRITAS